MFSGYRVRQRVHIDWTIVAFVSKYVWPRKGASAQLSGDTEQDFGDKATVVNPEEQDLGRNQILDSQYKCFEKMKNDPPYNKSSNDVTFSPRLVADE